MPSQLLLGAGVLALLPPRPLGSDGGEEPGFLMETR